METALFSMIDHIESFGATGDGTTASRAPRSRSESRRRRWFRHLPWRGRRRPDADRDSVGDRRRRGTRPEGTATAAATVLLGGVGLTEAQAREAGHEVMVGRQKLSAVDAVVAYDDRRARCRSTPDPVGHYLGGWHGAFRAGGPIVSLTPGPVWRRALSDGHRAVSQGWTGAVGAGLPRRADRA